MSETNGTTAKPTEDVVVRCDFFINHPPELLTKYAGQHVGWSFDGREVVLSADTFEELYAKADRTGIHDFVHSRVPHPDDPPRLGIWLPVIQ